MIGSGFPQQAAALKKGGKIRYCGESPMLQYSETISRSRSTILNYLEPELLRSLLITSDIFMRCPSAGILTAASINSKSEMTEWSCSYYSCPANPFNYIFTSVYWWPATATTPETNCWDLLRSNHINQVSVLTDCTEFFIVGLLQLFTLSLIVHQK